MIDQLVWSRKSKAATLAPISHSVFPFECLQFFHFSWIDVFLFRFFGFPTVWFRFLWWSGWIFNAPRSTITIDRMIWTFFDNFWWNYLLIISGGINISIQWNIRSEYYCVVKYFSPRAEWVFPGVPRWSPGQTGLISVSQTAPTTGPRLLYCRPCVVLCTAVT